MKNVDRELLLHAIKDRRVKILVGTCLMVPWFLDLLYPLLYWLTGWKLVMAIMAIGGMIILATAPEGITKKK